ncbi:MAG: AIR carboxylase family protein [Candidatus Diapherotrites archaeon]|nr:AIR carboxylase family protein [Candidatus Diapherotrites archaeon]
MNEFVPILMGSKGDFKFAKKIGETLEKFGVNYEYRVSSAHKTTDELLTAVKQYDASDKKLVYIGVAGRSNALGGVLEANTQNPVINCPPYSDKFGGGDIYSSLRMPSGMGCTICMEAANAAYAAVKIFALNNPELREKVKAYQQDFKNKVNNADAELKGKKVSEIQA